MSYYPELDDLSLTELVEAFHEPAPDGEEFAYTWYSDITWRLRLQGEMGNTALWNEIDKANTEQLKAILFALTVPFGTRPQVRPLTHEQRLELHDLLVETCLKSAEPLLVAEAVDGLSYLGDKDATNQVLAMRHHPSAFVRGSVLRYMARLWPERAYQSLIEALSDPHFIVRDVALDALGELGRPEAVPHIQPLLADEHPDVRQAALAAIEDITQIHGLSG